MQTISPLKPRIYKQHLQQAKLLPWLLQPVFEVLAEAAITKERVEEWRLGITDDLLEGSGQEIFITIITERKIPKSRSNKPLLGRLPPNRFITDITFKEDRAYMVVSHSSKSIKFQLNNPNFVVNAALATQILDFACSVT